MGQLQCYEAGSLDLADRFNVISRTISDNFGAHWSAEPIGSARVARFSWACAQGVDYSRAEMPALRLVNRGSGPVLAPKYNVFSVDQSFQVKIPGFPTLHAQPEEILIMGSDMACEMIMPRDYRTTAFIMDGDLFRSFVPDVWAYVGRPLRLRCGLENILCRTLEAAGDVSQAGLFDEAGPKLAQYFLEMLALLPLPDDEAVTRRSRNTLEIRRIQAKSFIDRNFTLPDLTVAAIAGSLKVSQRYLQMAFEGDTVTPLEYLRERRLDACARLLRNSVQRRRSITEISFSCGFNSSAHFSTQFRLKYGLSPREYRIKAAAEATAAI
jgi:AraC-like DNA-binding protein